MCNDLDDLLYVRLDILFPYSQPDQSNTLQTPAFDLLVLTAIDLVKEEREALVVVYFEVVSSCVC